MNYSSQLKICVFVLMVLMSVACGVSNQNIKSSTTQQNSIFITNSEAQKLSDSLDALSARICKEFNQEQLNLTLGIVKDGKVFLKKHYGFSNPQTNTRFSDQTQIYIASTSKSLTGTLAAILNKKGLILLDKTISDYLPDFTFNDPQLNAKKITLQSLLTHTHAIKNNAVGVWTSAIGHNGTDQILEMYKKHSSSFPNHDFAYSNIGPVLYTLIIEKYLKKPWQDIMEEQLFIPLNMLATTSYVSKVNKKNISYIISDKNEVVFDKKDNTMSSAGGHLTTVDDMLKYLQFFISNGKTVPDLLDEKAIEYAISPIVPQQSKYGSYQRYGFGLGWEQSILNGEKVISRFGGYSGISSHLSFTRNSGIGIIAISNAKGMESLSHLMANYCYNVLLNKSNTQQILAENLVALHKNYLADVKEKELLKDKLINKTIKQSITGNYDGNESGEMKIEKNLKVSWGNLKGRIYLHTDTSGTIDFGTMIRSLELKIVDKEVKGLYSNERYFTKVF